MHLVAVSVGNTRTRFGVFRGDALDQSGVLENTDTDAIAAAVRALPLDRPDAPLFLASVNPAVSDRVSAALEPAFRGRFHRFGPGLAVPIENTLTDDSTVGQDRLLNALGAYRRADDACIVIDAGTAVTVDLVDGQGVFRGGAIAPGLNMMLRALHEQTASLPMIRPGIPPGGPLGRDTPSAMRLGVRAAIIGMTHLLVERFAGELGAYPRVIATGGDAPALFENDEIVEHVVPDLTLLGIHAACERLLAADDHA